MYTSIFPSPCADTPPSSGPLKNILDRQTRTLTLIVTYQCTAACTDCCFGCTPQTEGRLSREQIESAILEAKSSFPRLEVVVFTGGECFLLKKDLFDSIKLATCLGLKTRCVTNGYWGKNLPTAEKTVKQLVKAGLTEINISSGKDHQEWVPPQSVINAAKSLIEAKIRTVVTIEEDGKDDQYTKALLENPTILELKSTHPHLFITQINTWMAFKPNAEYRDAKKAPTAALGPCTQIFRNIVITPHHMISACCGLTLEHIPEMNLGKAEPSTLRDK